MRFGRDVLEHAVGPHAVRADRRRPRFDLGVQAGDADLEELVEVAADDAQELQALEQRIARVLGLREHAARERELAELAVEIEMRREAALAARLRRLPLERPARARSTADGDALLGAMLCW